MYLLMHFGSIFLAKIHGEVVLWIRKPIRTLLDDLISFHH